MDLLNKVKINNPTAFSVIKNAVNNDKISHAYLFSAPKSVNIEDEADFLIQSIINDNPFEGEITRTIENYSDLQIIDGSKGLIKKADVTNASAVLQQTALDALGIKILLIRNVENGNKQSLNSLLKFIEEPSPKTYVIMTTNNLSQVISTVKSRAQIISLRSMPYEKLVNDIKEAGIDNKYVRVLASISRSLEEAKELNSSKAFQLAYDAVVNTMSLAHSNPDKVVTELSKYIAKKDFRVFMHLLRTFFNDVWKIQQGIEISFSSEEQLIEAYANSNFDFQSALHIINDFIVAQEAYVNFDLYRAQLLIRLRRCYG